MLGNTDQRRLTEIEKDLRSADPEFAERFDRVMLRCPQEWRGMTPGGWLLAAALVMGLAVLMGSGGMALIALSVAGVSAGMWLTRYIRSSDGRQPPQPWTPGRPTIRFQGRPGESSAPLPHLAGRRKVNGDSSTHDGSCRYPRGHACSAYNDLSDEEAMMTTGTAISRTTTDFTAASHNVRRDAIALTWDLTVHQLHQAFSRCVAAPSTDPPDVGASQELAWTRLVAARHAVDDIQAALSRMARGTYGRCQQCGSMIATDRLQASPTARWCATCQL